VRVMPVAQGSTTAGPWSCRPASFRASAARAAHSLARREEPVEGNDKQQSREVCVCHA
jgi:hypothetical protein